MLGSEFGYSGAMIWLPPELRDFQLLRSAVRTSVTLAGMACGISLFGDIADRLGAGRRS